MDYTKDINNIIEKVLTEKTFNLEIVEEIKKLREMPEKLAEADEQIKALTTKNQELNTEVIQMRAKAEEVNQREIDVEKREREQTIKDVENKAKDTLLKEYKDVMSLVFRNTTVRENLYNSKSVYRESGGYANQYNESEVITKDVVTE